jgi:pantoate--beta-alanine ligase
MASSISELGAMQTQLAGWRAQGLRIGFVPTMGGLHDGHCSLIRQAKKNCDRLIVSVFVNPTQFAEGEDLQSYPRDPTGDLAKASEAGADLVWFSHHDAIYPPGWATTIVPGGAGLGLETDHRPHFFTGVATVVARLFGLVRPDVVVFGEKDYQQLLVVKQLIEDLGLDVELLAAPLVRDPDGLALSSRNTFLDEAARIAARAVPRSLQRACEAFAAGERDPRALCAIGRAVLTEAGLDIDYFSMAASADLSPPQSLVTEGTSVWRFLVAARCCGVRLIDNCAADEPPWP